MCGICGAFSTRSSINPYLGRLKFALEMISHRGPDELRFVAAGNHFCGGTVRLAIEALDFGEQPVTSGDVTIGFNGEIFNYKRLAKLYKLGDEASRSEIQFLLEAWSKKGTSLFEDLDGQFAIFIYDSRKNELLLARDPFGIRPLFFTIQDNNYLFCSEVKGIFKLASFNFPFDEIGVAEIAMLWTTIGDRTVFEGIKQVRRGHFAVISNEGVVQYPYYKEPLLLEDRNRFSDKKDAADFLRFTLENSIKSQIHGEVGHASYLSGGIDSCALAYFLNKGKGDLDVFSISFENEEYDESEAQNVMAEALHVNQHSLKISKSDIASNFRSVINHAETLLFRTAPVPLFLLSKRVNELGHKVVFTGEGADEILLGYDLFAESRIRRFWSRSPESTWRPSLLRSLYSYLPQFKNSRYFSVIREFYSGYISETDNIFYSHLIRWLQFNQVASYFNFSRSIDVLQAEIMNDLNNCLPKSFESASHDRKAQVLEFETLLHGYLLSSQGDRMSMANSVEGRYPYLGKDFVHAMAQIGDFQKTRGIKSKSLFREAMSGFLPQNIVSRPKVAYQAPEAKSFLSHSYVSSEAEFLDDFAASGNLINHKNLYALNSKITNQFSSERLGFRENMSYVMCMSMAHLNDLKFMWSKNESSRS